MKASFKVIVRPRFAHIFPDDVDLRLLALLRKATHSCLARPASTYCTAEPLDPSLRMLPVFASLFAALHLLCFPSAWLQRGRVHHLPLTYFLEDGRLRYALLNWLMAVDFIRAVAGVWLLRHVLIYLPDVMPGHVVWMGYVNVILFVAMVLQLCFHRLHANELHAPLGYVLGVLVIVVPLAVALPALALAVATAIAARSLTIGLVVLAVGIVAFGLLLQIGFVSTVCYSALMGLPLVGVIGSNREFTLSVTVDRYNSTQRVANALSSRLR